MRILSSLNKKAIAYFSIIVFIEAGMDGFAFHWPHNQGFFSLTYGPDRITFLGMPFDAWHLLKRLLQLLIIFYMVGKDWFNLIVLALIALVGQVIIYNFLIKF